LRVTVDGDHVPAETLSVDPTVGVPVIFGTGDFEKALPIFTAELVSETGV
jgi:hypothetical protein